LVFAKKNIDKYTKDLLIIFSADFSFQGGGFYSGKEVFQNLTTDFGASEDISAQNKQRK
jgi:uncharacterized membrane protein YkvI